MPPGVLHRFPTYSERAISSGWNTKNVQMYYDRCQSVRRGYDFFYVVTLPLQISKLTFTKVSHLLSVLFLYSWKTVYSLGTPNSSPISFQTSSLLKVSLFVDHIRCIVSQPHNSFVVYVDGWLEGKWKHQGFRFDFNLFCPTLNRLEVEQVQKYNQVARFLACSLMYGMG